eukprot:4367789-Ditylum_brightwellii.AAC.1
MGLNDDTMSSIKLVTDITGALSRLNMERTPQRVRTAASSSSLSQLFTVQTQTGHFFIDTRKGGGDTSLPIQLHYYHHLPPPFLLDQ